MYGFDATKGFIQISRSKKGLFKTKPVTVFVNKLPVNLFPGEAKAVLLSPGTVTLTINKRKKTNYKVVAGETKALVVKEGLSNVSFCIKYGTLFLFLLFSVFSIFYRFATGQILFAGGVLSLAISCWMITEIRYEYFYLQEGKGLLLS